MPKKDYTIHKESFKQAYSTGSDVWTHAPLQHEVLKFTQFFPKDSFILDLGTGRGLWAFFLADLGFKIIGIDILNELVEENNKESKNRGLGGKVAFMEGDAFNIPLQDDSIDVVTDFKLLQHIYPEDWSEYAKEVDRVLKPGGFVFLIELSRETHTFLNFHPKESITGNSEHYGLHYHFFKTEEVVEIFGDGYELIKDGHVPIKAMQDKTVMFALLRKKP